MGKWSKWVAFCFLCFSLSLQTIQVPNLILHIYILYAKPMLIFYVYCLQALVTSMLKSTAFFEQKSTHISYLCSRILENFPNVMGLYWKLFWIWRDEIKLHTLWVWTAIQEQIKTEFIKTCAISMKEIKNLPCILIKSIIFYFQSEMALMILYLLMNWFDSEFGVNWYFSNDPFLMFPQVRTCAFKCFVFGKHCFLFFLKSNANYSTFIPSPTGLMWQCHQLLLKKKKKNPKTNGQCHISPV